MRRMIAPLILALALAGYAALFFSLESQKQSKKERLMPTMPTQMFQILGHTYMQQMFADMLFIKVAVFYGGENDVRGSVDEMVNHFTAMQMLHPKMIDYYYRAEAALADKGDEYVRIVNRLLAKGRKALPHEVVLPYFEGFNHYYYLDEPIKAAELLRLASTYDEKYQWLEHLASKLLAEGGNIRTGLAWLKGMYASMNEGEEKELYAADIQTFEKALVVQEALERYVAKAGHYPEHLDDLVPEWLSGLPSLGDKFYLDYQPPRLYLKIKDKRKQNKR